MKLLGHLILILFLSSLSLVADDSGGSATLKENLDLPFSIPGANQEDEDAPEIISLYGSTYRADGFVFVIGPKT